MRAIVVTEHGGPEVLMIRELPDAVASDGDVLIRVKAFGLNHADTYMRSGTYAQKPALPYTPGSGGGGVIEAVGEGVKKVKVGDRAVRFELPKFTFPRWRLSRRALPQKVVKKRWPTQ